MNFVTIDVETANSDIGSICQIGLAKYLNGKLIDTYCTLVAPQTSFSRQNIEVHGITSSMVKDAPSMHDIYGNILKFIGENIVVSYTNFDQRALRQSLDNHKLPVPELQWVDATVLVRRTCQRFAVQGYNLANVCKEWNYRFTHHDALEDAKACGFITVTILRENSLSIRDWVEASEYNSIYHQQRRVNNKSYPRNITKTGDEAGQYAGTNIRFTGDLSIGRAEIAEIAAKNGFNVKAGASKKLDYLVVGVQDLTLLAGHEKSSKHRKVEELIQSGIDIKVLAEKEFLKLIKISD
ncbi:exonuclease domain-containing protein [Psychrobacter fozii]|uniref:exonuclease domain-containing protein n=1 Tax=Psychrobacter fozii TaxID=198480 RepID=UPI00191AD7F2|nr:exonuclease domain-containing protein [Psychrobacter fozii]